MPDRLADLAVLAKSKTATFNPHSGGEKAAVFFHNEKLITNYYFFPLLGRVTIAIASA